MKVYKIRDRETGLFSTGGYYPQWERIGKFWHQMKYLRAHLRLVKSAYYYDGNVRKQSLDRYKNAEVVEYILDKSRVFTIEETMPQ